MISLVLVLKIFSKLFVGKKPPDEINVMAKLNELNDLMFIIFKIIKITNVRNVYKIKILIDCFRVSEVLNDKKLVKDFFKLISKISIKRIIENKKYNPPIHCDEDLHNIKLSSRCLILLNMVKPVEVKPEIDSK